MWGGKFCFLLSPAHYAFVKNTSIIKSTLHEYLCLIKYFSNACFTKCRCCTLYSIRAVRVSFSCFYHLSWTDLTFWPWQLSEWHWWSDYHIRNLSPCGVSTIISFFNIEDKENKPFNPMGCLYKWRLMTMCNKSTFHDVQFS